MSGCTSVPDKEPEFLSLDEVLAAAQDTSNAECEPAQSTRIAKDLTAQIVNCDGGTQWESLTVMVAEGADGFEDAVQSRLGSETAWGENWAVTYFPGEMTVSLFNLRKTSELDETPGEETVQTIATELDGWVTVSPKQESFYKLR